MYLMRTTEADEAEQIGGSSRIRAIYLNEETMTEDVVETEDLALTAEKATTVGRYFVRRLIQI